MMRTVVVVSAVVSLALGSAACVSHPVGPARTYGKYEGKAVTTAESVLSSVETVLLAAKTGSADHAFGPYLSVLISDTEEDVTGTQGTFESIQPPSAAGDHLRGELDQLLSDVSDHVAQVRIIARRGRIHDLADAAKDLEEDSQKLNDFIEAHKK
jgi:hypothetical protein